MDILINGKAADIKLENEKTAKDVLTGLEQWLSGSGNRVSGLLLDGELIGAASIAKELGRQTSEIKTMDIMISSWTELAADALAALEESCALYGNASFDEKKEIEAKWEAAPAAAFLREEIQDIALFAKRSFAGEGAAVSGLALLVQERLREISNPKEEILAMESIVSGIGERMEDLPLDIQTGKDGRAAETMRLFSQTGEKIFRLFGILKYSGFLLDGLNVDGVKLKDFNSDFSGTLGELLEAYNNNDTVLVGDLAEYELAPRLIKLYGALKKLVEVSDG